jgi:phosphate-selective porin OprO/OprP
MRPTAPVLLTSALLATLSAATLNAAETTASLEDGLRVRWDERHHLKIGGRVHYDVARFDDDVTPLEDDADFRRARISADARAGDWRARADYDWGVAKGWRSLFVQYRGFDDTRITVGNQVAPFSLDDLVGSNELTLPERSLASALSPGMLTGVSVQTWDRNWTLAGGLFGNELSDFDRRSMDGVSIIGRATWTPVQKRRRVLHLGVAQEFRRVDDNDEVVRFDSRPESRLTDARLVDTGSLTGIDDVMTTGVEFMGFIRNVKLQSEYLRASLDGAAVDADFSGGYAQLSVVLTGERYRYSRSRGAPASIRPRGAWGALEASARVSFLDLQDGAISGGEQQQSSVSLSWYPNQQLRVTLNYGRFEAEPNAAGIDEDGSVVTLRLQASL